ncbi:SelB C-terminal domain-containing protein [Dankookia sp. GCM10030260]|uniref:selenocysteine-specific translation elongation factor n=1 Tax=Dankookia sp. GCM10030260 TaxID=3273390 RepID=UPI003621A3B1
MRTALIAVLGHVDHGKTALVRALTGSECDRLPEERARGISIALGFARLALPDGGEVDLVDAPGHERFVRTMIAGASGMDAALLAVDAREGVRAQTREHVEIAALLGIRRGVVAIARCDLATPEERAAASAGTGALLAGLALGTWPVVETSARTGEGIAALATALGALTREGVAGPGGAWLPLDRAFTLPGAGVVVTGTLRRGGLALGDAVELLPGLRPATIRGLHVHGMAVSRAAPGRRVAVALRGIARGEVAPGEALATPGLLAPTERLDAWVTVLASAPRALRQGETLRLLCGTAEAGARLRLLGAAALAPGEAGLAQFVLDRRLALPVREPFVLRLPSPPRTVAGGMVLDPAPPRRRARDAPLLDAMRLATPARAASLRLRAAGAAGLEAASLARLVGVAPTALDAAAAEAVSLRTGPLLHRDVLAALEAKLLGAVEAAERADPMGPGPEAGPLLASSLPPEAPGAAIAARLVARGALSLAAGRLRLRGLDRVALLSDQDRAAIAAVEAAFRAGGLMPPDAAAVAACDPRRAQAIRLLLRSGVLLRCPDAVQKREVVFHAEAVATARAALAGLLAARPAGVSVSDCGARLGISRRFTVPLLERLDAEGFSRRAGDLRHLAAVSPDSGSRAAPVSGRASSAASPGDHPAGVARKAPPGISR